MHLLFLLSDSSFTLQLRSMQWMLVLHVLSFFIILVHQQDDAIELNFITMLGHNVKKKIMGRWTYFWLRSN